MDEDELRVFEWVLAQKKPIVFWEEKTLYHEAGNPPFIVFRKLIDRGLVTRNISFIRDKRRLIRTEPHLRSIVNYGVTDKGLKVYMGLA